MKLFAGGIIKSVKHMENKNTNNAIEQRYKIF